MKIFFRNHHRFLFEKFVIQGVHLLGQGLTNEKNLGCPRPLGFNQEEVYHSKPRQGLTQEPDLNYQPKQVQSKIKVLLRHSIQTLVVQKFLYS